MPTKKSKPFHVKILEQIAKPPTNEFLIASALRVTVPSVQRVVTTLIKQGDVERIDVGGGYAPHLGLTKNGLQYLREREPKWYLRRQDSPLFGRRRFRNASGLRRLRSPEHYTRVGFALGKPRGNRQDEYGIYKSPKTAYGQPVSQKLYAQYEGYREGDKRVGLPLGGPRWTQQPMIAFIPEHFDNVRFFDKSSSPLFGRRRFKNASGLWRLRSPGDGSIRPARNITPAERKEAVEWLGRRYRDQNLAGQISLKQYLSANLGFVVRNLRAKRAGSPHPIRAVKRLVRRVGRALTGKPRRSPSLVPGMWYFEHRVNHELAHRWGPFRTQNEAYEERDRVMKRRGIHPIPGNIITLPMKKY